MTALVHFVASHRARSFTWLFERGTEAVLASCGAVAVIADVPGDDVSLRAFVPKTPFADEVTCPACVRIARGGPT